MFNDNERCNTIFIYLFIFWWDNEHITFYMCIHLSICAFSPLNARKFDFGLHMMYIIMMNVKEKKLIFCFDFMCSALASWQEYLDLKALGSFEMKNKSLIYLMKN